MRTRLALHNLLHNKIKTSVAVTGVAFAIVLMFMQLGFLEAVKASATVIYDVLDFDICIRSKDYLFLSEARTFPRARLTQASAINGVESVTPFWVTPGPWRNPKNGQRRAILCFGVIPSSPAFRDADIQNRVRSLIKRSDDLLIDTKSRSEYGPSNGSEFGPQDVGVVVEVNGHKTRISGVYTLGAGLASSGAAIVGERGFRDIAIGFPHDDISLGLIKVAKNEDVQQAVRKLKASLENDVDVRSRSEVHNAELTYWVYETNYGLIFQTGVIMSLIVGAAIVYQVLAGDVASLLSEYATLKAMGYSNRDLGFIILEQAILLAIAGFVVGIVTSRVLYAVTAAGAQIPIRMTAVNIATVFLLSVMMCVGSGLAALRKAFKAEPANLF